MTVLFSPFHLRDITIRNRIMVAPMWQYRGVDGFATDWHLVHLGRFALGGAGLVMQEGTAISRAQRGTTGDLGLWDDAFIEPLSRITAFLRSQGAVPGIQLMHAGRKARRPSPWQAADAYDSVPPEDWNVVGATDAPHAPGYSRPRALTTADIASLVQAWAAAAVRADAAGYDVVELHAAHGYLLHEFLSDANTRDDVYGGSRLNRARFLFEVTAAVRAALPRAKPLLVRISAVDGAGWGVDDSVWLARELHALGVDAIDCSSGGIGRIGSALGVAPGYQVANATRIRAQAQVPTVAVGLLFNAQQVEEILRTGQADMVALGRELLLNPNWPLYAEQELESTGFALAPEEHAYFLAARERAIGARSDRISTRAIIDEEKESAWTV